MQLGAKRHRDNTPDRRCLLAADLLYGVVELLQKQVISVTLPESGTVANVSDTVEISLDAAGMYFVAGQPVGARLMLAAMQSVRTLTPRRWLSSR